MTKPMRGADLVASALTSAGVDKVFTLSGNHIMSIFDAAIGSKLDLVHVRHEAAAVHMADAYGRMTGKPGIAMLTGGPGHANGVGALYTALCAESPMVLISGHAGTDELGRGGFQEIRQADMACPVCKAAWTSTSAETMGADIAEALRIAASGRPGPVHLSLPSDLLDQVVEANAIRQPSAAAHVAPVQSLPAGIADAALAELAKASRPLILAGPQLAHTDGRKLVAALEQATGIPVVIMEAVRGINDATLGAFGDVLKQADAILLLGKPLDFTLKFGEPPFVAAGCRFLSIDPDPAMLARAMKAKGGDLVLGAIADARAATATLTEHAKVSGKHAGWLADARKLMSDRPAAWATQTSGTAGRMHPLEVFRAVKPFLERDPNAVLVCDGGEFSQWSQSVLPARRRMINSVAGAIGPGIPSAIAARTVEPAAPIFAIVGDGTFGFHMSEFDTAVRSQLPFVCIVGNDQRWNAEYQIQVREYGRDRTIGCELLPTRYDQVVVALGGHGEMVDDPAKLSGAIERALASGKPACINVMIEGIAAPILKKGA